MLLLYRVYEAYIEWTTYINKDFISNEEAGSVTRIGIVLKILRMLAQIERHDSLVPNREVTLS